MMPGRGGVLDAIHDMRNLLGVISGHADVMLAMLPARDPLRDRVDAIRSAVASGRALASRLLEAGSGRDEAPARAAAVDLNSLVAAVARMLGGVLGPGIALEVDADRPLPAVVGIRTDLERALVNLAVNGREAMPRGGRLTLATASVEVAASAAGDTPPGSWAVLTVADTGVGMDAAVAARAFEPYFTTKPGPGRGRGLVGVEAVVRAHGGFVRVQSAPGAGSTFRVYLPVAAGCRARMGGATVLVVEDETEVRDLVGEILDMNGYRTLVTPTADEALRVAAGHAGAIDLLIADVVVPGIPIRDLVTAVRRIHPAVAVVYISGQPEPEVARRAGPLTAPLLRKPFGVPALLDTVRGALGAG